MVGKPYLLGKAFDIVTDHQSLTWLQGLKEPKGRLTRWILALQEYVFEINHRPGKQHSNADTLSRFPRVTPSPALVGNPEKKMMTGVAAMKICTSWSREEIIRAQKDDPNISLVMRRLGRSEAPTGNEAEDRENRERRRYRQLQTQLEMLNGILHRRVDKGTPSERLVLVVPRMMRADLLKLSHGDPSSGHMGINRCLERLQKRYYWPGRGWHQKCNCG